MRVTLHWAERFINWFPHNTKLYVRRKNGTDCFQEDRELFSALAPFLDGLRAEAKAEGAAEERDAIASAFENIERLEISGKDAAVIIRARGGKP